MTEPDILSLICLPDANAVPLDVRYSRVDANPAVTRDLRDEALEDMRQELAEARLERDRWKARVLLLEARLEAIRKALVKR